MKKYKLTILLAALTFSMASFAQNTRWGIQAGATYSNMTVAYDDESESFDYKPGFTAGFMMDKKIGKSFFFQPALNFVQKGFQNDRDIDSYKVTLNYLELPLNFVYRQKKESGFFIGAGPSIGCGLGGTLSYDYDDEKESIDFGGDDNIDRFEVEANLITGYMFPKKLQIALSYNFGLTNIMDDDSKVKNNYFALRIGYYLK